MTLSHQRYPDYGSRDSIGRLNAGKLQTSYLVLFDGWVATRTVRINLNGLFSLFGIREIYVDFKNYIPFTIQLCWEF